MKLVERDEQLEILDKLLSDTASGHGHVVLLDGSIASGKTEVLHAFGDRATRSGALYLHASCHRAESTVPLGVLSQLLDSVPLPAELAERVRPLLRDGATLPAETDGDGPVPPELARVLHALSLAFLELSTSAPVVIGIDTVRHADPASLDCLLRLGRRLRNGRVLLVLTDDTGMLPSGPPLHSELLRQPHAHRIRITSLSRDGVRQFLGERMDPTTAEALAPAIHAAGGGHPLLTRVLAEDHAQSGEPRAQGFGATYVSCLHRGDQVLLRVARALAVLGSGATSAELGRLIDVETGLVERTLKSLSDNGLLNGAEFRHPLARAAVLNFLPAQDGIELHRRAAQLRHEQGSPAVTVARHLVSAKHGQTTWATGALLEAAEHALLDDKYEFAADCLRLAHRCTTDEHDRATIRARLAHAEWQYSPSAAGRHLAPLAAGPAEQLDRGQGIALVRKLLWLGRNEEAADVLERLRGLSGDEHTEEAAAALRDTEQWLAYAHPPLARRRHPSALPDRRVTLVTPRTEPQLQVTALLANGLVHGRSPQLVDRAEQVLRELRLGGATSWGEEAALVALHTLVQAERLDTAVEWCDQLLEDAHSRRAPTSRALFAGIRAHIALRQGDLPSAVRFGQAALTYLAHQSWGVAVGLPLSTLALAATRMGDYEDAAKYLTRVIPEAAFQSRYGLHYLHARGHYRLATNHTHAALADFLACGDLVRRWGLDNAGLVPWRTSAAEAWLQLGNQDQARQLLHEQLGRLGNDRTRVRALTLRLLAETVPPSRRPQLLTEALDLFEAAGDRYEQARVLSELSRAYYATGDKRRARLLFRHALYSANQCEAKPIAQELLAVTDNAGARPGAAPDNCEGVASLTESERRVASLAVMGYTNREIADRLYITASTVEQHLTRVYRKLNVKRRKDLPVGLWADVSKTA
ncbi:AAA family ATPase [Streptomyces hokutonensis]|uniref:AAA family ATPase n=1 Tax=Streptomyces hokutonensis TaxID=1306990 RepID=UPI0003698358|nr:LuxR family transcriptional regulator [Streptomyces hokutonensis]